MNIIIKNSILKPFTSLLKTSLNFSFSLLEAKPNKKPQATFTKWTILKGDIVKVITGKDKTKVGKVMKVHRRSNQITVRGVNIKIKRVKNPQTGTSMGKRKAYPIHVSNAGIYDNVVKKAVRVRFGFHPETGEKLRISKASGVILKKPVNKYLNRQRRGKKKILGKKDTTSDVAHRVTYQGQDFQAIKKQFDQYIREKQKKQKYLVFKE